MAEQPYGYGQYLYHPSTIYPPSGLPNKPSYHTPPAPGAVPPTNVTANQSAYDYNSNRIPGLGLGGAPVSSTSFSPSVPQTWHIQAPTSQAKSQFQNHPKPPSSVTKQPPSTDQSNSLEEGELSEGEFEDIYEPKQPTNFTREKPRALTTSASFHNVGSGGESMGDATLERGQEREQHYSPDDEWEPSYPERERSGSYSPYLSPREVHRRISIAKATPRENKTKDRVENGRSLRPSDKTPSILPKAAPPVDISAHAATNGDSVLASVSKNQIGTNGTVAPLSLLEAKKRAQEAILGLWPLKVRYQDYIQEGFNERVVQGLFKDLGLDVPVTKPTLLQAEKAKERQAAPVNPIKPTTGPVQAASQAPDNKSAHLRRNGRKDDKDTSKANGETKAAEKSAAEERKDKIARKLAAMAQKTTAAPSSRPNAETAKPTTTTGSGSTPIPASVTKPVPRAGSASLPALEPVAAPAKSGAANAKTSDSSPTTPAVTKTRAENNAILQQKLAALKRQQALLAADKAKAASRSSTTTSSPAPAEPQFHGVNKNNSSVPKIVPGVSPRPSSQQPSSPAEGKSQKKDENIPGLSLQSTSLPLSTQNTQRTLKRPVASDFDKYTPSFQTMKRTRTDERLVIDVSDDEDIEMDMGSPTEETGPSMDSSAAPRPSLGAFPPLSDGPLKRQQPSPAANSSATPPIKGARIDLLHKRIEETKRLIAEAEAKKAAKRDTPQQSPAPSSPVVQQAASLPEAPKVSTEVNKGVSRRRDRIASFDLPRISATLKEKQDKLKAIVAEAARLELELQADLEEEMKLRAEMERQESPVPASPLPVKKLPSPSQAPIQSPKSDQHNQPHPQGALAVERSHSQEPLQATGSSSADSDEEMDVDMNDDEASQAAIMTDNTASPDQQPVTATVSNPTSDDVSTDNTSYHSSKGNDQAQPAGIETTKEVPAEKVAVVLSPRPRASPAVAETLTGNTAPSEANDESSDSDISMQQSVRESSESDDESYEPTLAKMTDAAPEDVDQQQSAEALDDVLEEPNPYHTAEEKNPVEAENPSVEDNQGNPPVLDLLSYKSPLSYFHAYRFHPKYFEDVPGGLKSTTFSSRIDPMREVCPVVLAGEACPKGPKCEYQHFDSMVLSEAEIITQLGSADMFTGETRTKFVEGLKRVLNDLKANRIKDFDRITRAIVQHRQEFLGDKSKVLALGQ
ncbi:hypothetical protein GGS20DRAFT_527426 [Poronia punctata]|nr:hypothetical protein GGS20DRAFT_527426 [Poronia punctata]